VTDHVEEIVPDFLTLLRGVIDSPDIPLNVSRSYLQSDANVKKISAHITKKVADKLEELYKKDRQDFEQKWEDIRIFVQYGMISEEKFYDKAKNFALLRNTENECFTLDEYREKIKALQTDKDDRVVHLYATNKEEQHTFIASARNKGYDVLVLDSMIDPHFINHLESKLDKASFVRVDADTVDKLIKKDEVIPSKLSETEQEQVKGWVDKEKFSVVFEPLDEKEVPMLITRPEFMRRMKDMSALSGGSRNMFGDLPEMHQLVVNANHPLMGKVLEEKDEEKKKNILKQSADLALLSQGMLKGEELSNFIRRSVELIG
jgi:molecular chaperone HtpG